MSRNLFAYASILHIHMMPLLWHLWRQNTNTRKIQEISTSMASLNLTYWHILTCCSSKPTIAWPCLTRIWCLKMLKYPQWFFSSLVYQCLPMFTIQLLILPASSSYPATHGYPAFVAALGLMLPYLGPTESNMVQRSSTKRTKWLPVSQYVWVMGFSKSCCLRSSFSLSRLG